MSNQGYWKFFISFAIALSCQSSMDAQVKTDTSTSLSSIREQLSSEWENASLTRSWESPTEVNSIKFSPDGQLLATVGTSQIMLWDVDKGEVQQVLPGHSATEMGLKIAPTAIAFSPDSRFLATSTWSQGLLSPDQAIIVRDITTGKEVLSISESDGCRQILFDVSGEVIYGACGLGVTAWSFPDGKELFNFATKYPVDAIALSPDGKIMATVDANVSEGKQGEQSHPIQLWTLAPQPTLLNTLDGHANDIAQLEFTADGKRLVSSSYDGKINVWNWRQGTIYRNTNNLHSSNGMFSLSANSQLIAGNFHSSGMTNLITGLPLKNVMQLSPNQETSLIAFSPQHQLFARIVKSPDSNKSLINLWQVRTDQPDQPASIKDDYRAIDIAEYWSNKETPEISEVEINKPSAIGKDPQAIALSGLGFGNIADLQSASIAKSDRLEIQEDYSQDNIATVTITQTKLSDDSVEGYRYLIQFAPYGDQTKQKWQIVWAGEQFRCWLGRGHQDWGTDLCH